MAPLDFTPDTLVTAIRTLFEQNNYTVEGPRKIHGAEVDLIIRSNADPFAPFIYVEATVEYVNVDKYGKDSSKFLLIQRKEPNSTLLCVSSSGFSLPVRERAQESGVNVLTYEDLFSKFQRFANYVDNTISKGPLSEELSRLDAVYEEARFEDQAGKEYATRFLSNWRLTPKPEHPWIIVIGDYGTGKTALTKVLQRRWIIDYPKDPSKPIPFRIELRDFTRQFDARGLLHHFLDTNGLSHLPVDFVFTLIRQGKVVLLLDGYDEMAQYMHARERRVCLAALAELAKDGAKGILTSRPNYFTEAEELHLLDTLYTSLFQEKRLSQTGQAIIEHEKALDSLLQSQFLERYERFLRDLDKDQTQGLVRRSLANDVEGQETVLRILDMVFRSSDEGAVVSLSGKPVIISYLLEVVEELKTSTETTNRHQALTEWQVYELIVDKLMWRDYRRAPEVSPQERREFLQQLAIKLSMSQSKSIDEHDFISLVEKCFQNRLRRYQSETREQELQKIFADTRSSATLTRRIEQDKSGWSFSHNSLREFLAAEYLISQLLSKNPRVQLVSVSDAMKIFVASLTDDAHQKLTAALADLKNYHPHGDIVGMYMSLLWEAALRMQHRQADPVSSLVSRVFGRPADFTNISLHRINFCHDNKPTDLTGGIFVDTSLTDVNFSNSNLTHANFSGSTMEGVDFKNANLQGADFKESLLLEINLVKAQIKHADFRKLIGLDAIHTENGLFSGNDAIGYLAYAGAITDKVPAIHICIHHSKYSIAEKIARKLYEQPTRQERGLVQRGVASRDKSTAQEFMHLLLAKGFLEELGGREGIVRTTREGRGILRAFCEGERLDEAFYEFFEIPNIQ